MVNFASQLGKASGALFGGVVIQRGRKQAFLWGHFFAMLSCLLMQHLSFTTLVIGKFLNGFFVTIVQIVSIKIINETTPVYLIEKYAPMWGVFVSTGYFLVMVSGLGLPKSDYHPEFV